MKKLSPPIVGLLQAIFLSLYCALIGTFFWKANSWFGNINNLFAPFIMLSLFVVSALICAIISLGYPFIIFWDKKNTKQAIKMVLYTAGWLILFIIIFLSFLVISK